MCRLGTSGPDSLELLLYVNIANELSLFFLC